jgi:hypothetical protein
MKEGISEAADEKVVSTSKKSIQYHTIDQKQLFPPSRKSGPSKDQSPIKMSSESKTHQKEFAIASVMSKVLRKSLSPCMSEICGSYVSGKLTAQFRNLSRQEEGISGIRPVQPSKYGHLLSGFEFNPKSPYNQIFGAKYHVKPGSRKGQVILHFPEFVPQKAFKHPQEATNFKINARLVALSDYVFDSVKESYIPRNQALNGHFGSFESQMFPILKIPMQPITAQVFMPEAVKVNAEHIGFFLIMAISFYRYEKGKFIHLKEHSGMKIHQVY